MSHFFDTLKIQIPGGVSMEAIRKAALENKINLRYIDDNHIGISIDETTELADINIILAIFAKANGKNFTDICLRPERV